jgi:hypothetical protein
MTISIKAFGWGNGRGVLKTPLPSPVSPAGNFVSTPHNLSFLIAGRPGSHMDGYQSSFSEN